MNGRMTDEQIDAIADAQPGGLSGFLKGWGWRQFARAIEARILGETEEEPDPQAVAWAAYSKAFAEAMGPRILFKDCTFSATGSGYRIR